MPVFISYCHEDKTFVDNLATNLIKNKTNVWLDTWEVSAGESLIEKVQQGLQASTALIVVLSKASVASIWCKREVISGIQRELEEKRTLVIPLLLEQCEMPLFLRDKRYADFRTNFDSGLDTILEAIAKVSNPSLGRIEEQNYHTDWSHDCFDFNGHFGIRFTQVQHGANIPYCVLSTITILCTEEATKRYRNYQKSNLELWGQIVIIESILSQPVKDFFILLEDNFAKENTVDVFDPKTQVGYHLHMETRRLGEDTGRNILIHGDIEIKKILGFIKERTKEPTREDIQRLTDIIKNNFIKK